MATTLPKSGRTGPISVRRLRGDRKLVVTGASRTVGTQLIGLWLERQLGPVLSVGGAPPVIASPRITHVPLDLTLPRAEALLSELLAGWRDATVVHLSFLSMPSRSAQWTHELESVGTTRMLHACQANRMNDLTVESSTLVYGARPDHPAQIPETAALANPVDLPFLRERLAVEQQLALVQARDRRLRLRVLRLAPTVGLGVSNIFTRLFQWPALPIAPGFDPMWQLLHARDAAEALYRAALYSAAGVFNIVPKMPLPLTHIGNALHRPTLSLPAWLWQGSRRLLNPFSDSGYSREFFRYFKFPCVADGAAAQAALGFQAQFSTRDAAVLLRTGEAS